MSTPRRASDTTSLLPTYIKTPIPFKVDFQLFMLATQKHYLHDVENRKLWAIWVHIKILVVWNVMSYRNVNSYRIGEAYCLHFRKEEICESWIVNQGDEDQFTNWYRGNHGLQRHTSPVLVFVWNYFFAFLQKLYIYNTYGGYTCYFRNSNIRTAPQFQAVRLFHNVRSRNAGRHRCS